MINYYLKYKTRKISSIPPSIEDIKVSGKILFSIFTRYGDTIIDLMIIKEFVKKYPNKDYLIICPKQMEPYVKEFLPNLKCKAFNKRNLFELAKVIKLLKNERFDIGFNPWSNGLDSCYFISFCKKFLIIAISRYAERTYVGRGRPAAPNPLRGKDLGEVPA